MRLFVVCAIAGTGFFLLQSAGDGWTEGSAEFDGFTEACQIVNVGSAVDGILETVHVERGDVVKKGQVLATLESKVEKATLDLTIARAQLRGELDEQKARLEYSQVKFAQDAELHEKGLLSDEEYKQRETERRLAEAGVLKAEEDLQLAELDRRRAEAALELRVIRSPVDGVVIDRYLSPGELVTRHNQSKIIGVAQIDPLRVEVLVPGSLFGKIEPGKRAKVLAPAFPDGEIDAEVKVVDPVIDAASGMFRVRLEMLNAGHEVPAGLKCRVRFGS